MGVLGLLGTFAPEQVLHWVNAAESPALLVMVQVLGALYLGFAGLNWMARENLIGGIYSRPVAIGNLMHFLVAGIAMVRFAARHPDLQAVWPLAVIYVVFAVSFGIILFRHPVGAE